MLRLIKVFEMEYSFLKWAVQQSINYQRGLRSLILLNVTRTYCSCTRQRKRGQRERRPTRWAPFLKVISHQKTSARPEENFILYFQFISQTLVPFFFPPFRENRLDKLHSIWPKNRRIERRNGKLESTIDDTLASHVFRKVAGLKYTRPQFQRIHFPIFKKRY